MLPRTNTVIYFCTENIMQWRVKQQRTKYKLTFSKSDSFSAKASSILSITEAAATSKGVAPRIDGEATEQNIKQSWHQNGRTLLLMGAET